MVQPSLRAYLCCNTYITECLSMMFPIIRLQGEINALRIYITSSHMYQFLLTLLQNCAFKPARKTYCICWRSLQVK